MKTALYALLLTLGFAAAHAEDNLIAHPHVEIVTTEGTIKLELETKEAPVTVRHFLGLVEKDFYDGLIFHRVISGFMIQAGGHTPDMSAREDDTRIVNESGNAMSNTRGTVAMARTGDPHSANSQFFINVADNSRLDPQKDPVQGRWGYTVFGYVIEGMDVVDRIAETETGIRDGHQNVPVVPVVIKQMSRTN